MTVEIVHGDMTKLLPEWAKDGLLFDACVCDPPYHLTSIVERFGKTGSAPAKGNEAFMRASKGFMGQTWDGGDVALDPATWRAVYDVLKPGAHLLAMGGTRTYHRLVCAIEDAGFEIRDTIGWVYGSGFPKSHNVAESIDKAARGVPHGGTDPTSVNHGKYKTQSTEGKRTETDTGQGFGAGPGQFMREKGEKQNRDLDDEAVAWSGWGTALKPAMELICVARKPLGEKTIAANVLKHGTGALNVDGCRVELDGDYKSQPNGRPSQTGLPDNYSPEKANMADTVGRWPANLCHDGSADVLECFPDTKSGKPGIMRKPINDGAAYGAESRATGTQMGGFGDEGSAARFFYQAKASGKDRVYFCETCGCSCQKSEFSLHAHGKSRFDHITTHPTCKPLALMRWLVRLVTPREGLILDPFAGSGTTGQAAMEEGFSCVLVEQSTDYIRDINYRMWLAQK